MERIVPLSFTTITAPLDAAFGDGLTFARAGNGVCWSYGGQSAVVDFRDDGSLEACFLTTPSFDAVRGTLAAGAYRPDGRGYALTPSGCERMVADTIAFFSGVREPQFAFIGVV